MNKSSDNKTMINDLMNAIVKIDNEEECLAFFEDLCTYKEVEAFAQRFMAAKLLLEGKTYAEVIALTNISSATLSRISRAIQYGPGGYKSVIEKK